MAMEAKDFMVVPLIRMYMNAILVSQHKVSYVSVAVIANASSDPGVACSRRSLFAVCNTVKQHQLNNQSSEAMKQDHLLFDETPSHLKVFESFNDII